MPCTRPAVRDADRLPMPVHLRIDAQRCPQVMLRVLGLIAQQAIIPAALLFERRERSVRLEVEVDGLSDYAAQILLEKVRMIVAVRSARFVRRRR